MAASLAPNRPQYVTHKLPSSQHYNHPRVCSHGLVDRCHFSNKSTTISAIAAKNINTPKVPILASLGSSPVGDWTVRAKRNDRGKAISRLHLDFHLAFCAGINTMSDDHV